MKYTDIRNSLKSGDILVMSPDLGTSLKSSIVRFFTVSEYSHVGIIWKHLNRVFVIEAQSPYIRIVPLSNMLPCYILSADKPMSKEAIDVAMNMVGTEKYSTLEAIKSILGMNGYNKKWQCVEFVKYVLKTDGYLFSEIDTPSNFVREYCEKYNGVLSYVEE